MVSRRETSRMLKIERGPASEKEQVYRLTGRIDAEHLEEIRSLLESAHLARKRVVLDLESVSDVDRDTVRFFTAGPGRAAHLLHCPAYVKEWCRVEARRRPRGGKALVLGLVALLAAGSLSAETIRLSLREAIS